MKKPTRTPERLTAEEAAPLTASHANALLMCLRDLEPHNTSELKVVGSHRFGAAIQVLRDRGYRISAKRCSNQTFDYTLQNLEPDTKLAEQIAAYKAHTKKVQNDLADLMLANAKNGIEWSDYQRALYLRLKRGGVHAEMPAEPEA